PGDIGNLYMLRLTYKIFPVERSLPTAREMKTREEADVVNLFVEAFAKKRPHPDDLALARRLLSHDNAERIVAGLLRDHLGARPEAIEEAKAIRRSETTRVVESPGASSGAAATGPERAKTVTTPESAQPKPNGPGRPGQSQPRRARERSQPRHAPPKRPEREAEPRASRAERAPSDVPEREQQAPGSLAAGEIFINVGRKDGAKPSDFQGILEAQAFELDEIDYVRVRQRHTFVGVPEELTRRALNALDGAQIAGRKAMAELARPRGN